MPKIRKIERVWKNKKIRKNTLENLVKELGKILGKIRKKYSRILGKILWKIRKNTPQNQDAIVKITFSNYARAQERVKHLRLWRRKYLSSLWHCLTWFQLLFQYQMCSRGELYLNTVVTAMFDPGRTAYMEKQWLRQKLCRGYF